MSDLPQTVAIDGPQTLIVALVVLYVGKWVAEHSRLRDVAVPSVVIGGLLCSLVLLLLYRGAGIRLVFATGLRDDLLLVFFATVGLSARWSLLRQWLTPIVVLLALATALLILQDVIGSAIAAAFRFHPADGLAVGSISLMGGPGTAVAWGGILEGHYGIEGARDVALTSATIGIVVGGLIGAPLARRLIVANGLAPDDAATAQDVDATTPEPVSLEAVLGVLLKIALCVAAATGAGEALRGAGVALPDFVLALGFAAVIGNVALAMGARSDTASVRLIGDVSLQILVAVAIMTIQLWSLAGLVGPFLVVFICQVALAAAFTYWIVFPTLGRDYNAAVASAGVLGFALGTTAVGLANMRAITHRYGPSPMAYLVVPIVGAFLVDFVNAGVVQLYLTVEIFR